MTRQGWYNALFSFIAMFAVAVQVIAQERNISKNRSEELPPNIIFILVDDLGWKDLGCFGSSFYETPNIDALAAGGMKFTNAYAASPVCSPTRSSILTGKNPARTQNTDWFGAPQPENAPKKAKFRDKSLLPAPYKEYLELNEKTIAEALKEGGYATFFAGKWHLGHEEKFWPENQGFDINKGGHRAGGPYGGDKYFSPYGNPRLQDGPEGEHLPDRLARETTRFIEDHKDKAFFAFLSFYSVHTPLMAREDLKEKYQRKKKSMGLEDEWAQEGSRRNRIVQCHPVYSGMVEAMDEAVGKVTDKLKELDLEENTAIILMSDNGGLSTSEGHPTSNLPLRAGKGWLYEGGIREPMIIKWPGVIKNGSNSEYPVISMDFYPTILEMAGLPKNPEQHMDGVSLMRLLHGENELDREVLYWHYPHYGNQGGSPGSAIRQGDWKLIWWYEDNKTELYNLKEDIEEQNDLSQEHPKLLVELKNKLHKWLYSTGAKMPSQNPYAKGTE
jgi:arylsulfatase A-like enzyme